MSEDPKISIIMGVYNCGVYVQACLNSIISQTFQNWELILCDDGSTDNSYDICCEIAQNDSRIRLLRNVSNKGLSFTLNQCLKLANGEYVARFDADDTLLPNCLEILLEEMRNDNQMSVISGGSYLSDDSGVWGKSAKSSIPSLLSFLVPSPVSHVPSLIKKEVLIEVNGYSTKRIFRRCEDYHLWAKMFRNNKKLKNIDRLIYIKNEDQYAISKRTFREYINISLACFFVYYMLKIPFYFYPCALRAVCVGLLPKNIYLKLHKRRFIRNK